MLDVSNIADLEGNTPLWEAFLGKHDYIAKLLLNNGGNIAAGDMGQFVCMAAEQNNLDLLHAIVHLGGNVTVPKANGTTALHLAVSEGNIEVVKFLVDQGSDIDKPDMHGWTPRALADQQSHEEIRALFQAKKEETPNPSLFTPIIKQGIQVIGTFRSEPSMQYAGSNASPFVSEGPWGSGICQKQWHKTNNFHNSLYGIISAAHAGGNCLPSSTATAESYVGVRDHPLRVTISIAGKTETRGKLVLLPNSIQELLWLGAKTFGFLPTKVLTEDKAEVDDIELIRDGDRLLLVREDMCEESQIERLVDR